jgi:undecaprenyl-diphosphatase
MNILESLFLGIVQGLTEFLPVSSSGHLIIFQYYLGLREVPIFFDIFLHFATLLAVVVFFYKRLVTLEWPFLRAVIISTFPVLVVGFFFRHYLDYFSSLLFVLVQLFVTGVINLIIEGITFRRQKTKTEPELLDDKKALIIGVFQTVALIPAISRSGTTVLGGLLSKLSRKDAFEFSFIMSIPVILIASVVELFDYATSGTIEKIPLSILLAGGLAAFITGLMSLRLFKYVIEKAKLEWFGWYCIVLSIALFVVEYLPRL